MDDGSKNFRAMSIRRLQISWEGEKEELEMVNSKFQSMACCVFQIFKNRERAYLEQNDDSRRRVVVLRVAVDEADLQGVGAFSWRLLKIKKQKGRQGRSGLQGKTLRVRTWRIALCIIYIYRVRHLALPCASFWFTVCIIGENNGRTSAKSVLARFWGRWKKRLF